MFRDLYIRVLLLAATAAGVVLDLIDDARERRHRRRVAKRWRRRMP